jgi:hypothetical protein
VEYEQGMKFVYLVKEVDPDFKLKSLEDVLDDDEV